MQIPRSAMPLAATSFKFCKHWAFAALLVFSASAPSWATTPVERVRAFVDGTRTFRAAFTQTIASKVGKKTQTSSGVVLLARPGKFRWQIDKPYPQLMVGDGQKVWLHDPDLKQVTVRKMSDTLSGTPAALLAGDSAIEKSFELSDDGGRDGLDWVMAVPRSKDASFSRIALGFRGDNLQRMEMHDNFGQVTTVVFANAEKNPVLAPGLFRFTPPAGTDVVGE